MSIPPPPPRPKSSPIDWDSECDFGVKREYATQHGKCTTCKDYELNKNSFLNKCWYWINKGK